MEDFPIFQKSSEQPTNSSTIVGVINETNYVDQVWISDGHYGFLFSGNRIVKGRWTSQGNQWSFKIENIEDALFCAGTSVFSILDWYWGERAEIVLNAALIWQKREIGRAHV